MRLPEQIRAENMIVEDKITALYMLLARLACPNWLADLRLKFGWKPERISRIVKELLQFIHETLGHLLVFDAERLTPQRLSAFTIAIRERNAPLETCFGFVDGTLQEIARPIYGQEAIYNGWKHMHCLKYQAVVMLDGITIHLFGLVEGSIHDAAVWSQSRLLDILEVHTHDPNGTSLQLYGDSAYGINEHLITPFGSAYINQDQQDWNKAMSKVQIIVEWCFKEVIQMFPFLYFSQTQ
jgi:hypothetical protein